MELKKQFIVGMLIGVLVGAIAGYGFCQIAYLQNQISQLQTSNAEIADLQSQIQQLQNQSEGGNVTTIINEALQFTDAKVQAVGNIFNITMILKNTGENEATIEAVLLNGQPLNYPVFMPNSGEYAISSDVEYGFSSATIAPGATVNGYMQLPIGTTWYSGMEVVVAVQTVAGNQYPVTIYLP
jgi:hypothetical protein